MLRLRRLIISNKTLPTLPPSPSATDFLEGLYRCSMFLFQRRDYWAGPLCSTFLRCLWRLEPMSTSPANRKSRLLLIITIRSPCLQIRPKPLQTLNLRNRPEGDVTTNLCMAVKNGFTTMVEKLLASGADVNAPSM